MSRNHCIGKDGLLPWHLRDDLQHFKRITLGKPIIMGRKTYDSIGKALPGRLNIVVSRNSELTLPDCRMADSLASAYQLATEWCVSNSSSEYFVIGGAELYRQSLAAADRLYLSLVDVDIHGDAWFPELNLEQWLETGRQEYQRSEHNDWDFSILEFKRRDSRHITL